MPRLETPLPGLRTATASAEHLGMSRDNFYKTGIAEWLDYYQNKASGPKLYKVEQLKHMSYWLNVRKGQIALGTITNSTPILPPPYDGDLAAFVEADEYGIECPVCGLTAVQNPRDESEEYWCSAGCATK